MPANFISMRVTSPAVFVLGRQLGPNRCSIAAFLDGRPALRPVQLSTPNATLSPCSGGACRGLISSAAKTQKQTKF